MPWKQKLEWVKQMSKALRSALSHFEQKNAELCIGGKQISEIVRDCPVPCYLYDTATLNWRYRTLKQDLPQNISINYAVKANSNHQVLVELSRLYDGFDIASKGEMTKALDAGIKPEQMSFAGPGKSVEELRFAVEHKIGTISIENEREIEHLINICDETGAKARVLIRVNPDFELSKSGMKMGGGPKQFGIDSERIPEIVKSICREKLLGFEGIHIFAGSQNLNATSILEAFGNIIDYASELATVIDAPIRTLNLGGGFGIPYFANDDELDVEHVGKGLGELIGAVGKPLNNTKFKIELGRFIVGECGIYVSRVLYRKLSRGHVFLVLNGGMHHHLAASGNFGQSVVRRPMPVTVVNKLDNPTEKVNIVGPLCTPLDTFGMNVEIPRAEEGDLIAVLNSGAYGYSASPLGFLSHELPIECLL